MVVVVRDGGGDGRWWWCHRCHCRGGGGVEVEVRDGGGGGGRWWCHRCVIVVLPSLSSPLSSPSSPSPSPSSSSCQCRVVVVSPSLSSHCRPLGLIAYISKNKIKAKKSDNLLPPGWTCRELGVMGASIHIKIKIEAVNVSEV